MGFFKKMKDSITGGAANVSIEYPTTPIKPGDSITVKVTVMSTGGEVKSNGVFVDLIGEESGQVVGSSRCEKCGDFDSSTKVKVDRKTHNQSIPLSGAFQLGANETKVFEQTIQIPSSGQPSYHGSISHQWKVRGRMEAFGNDPDSGYQTITVKG